VVPLSTESAPDDLNLPVVVAVLFVLVVKVSVDDIVDMVAVRDSVVPALPTVGVVLLMRAARVGRRAGGGIRLSGCEDMLVDVTLVEMMQVSVVEVVSVPLVLDRFVSAGGAVGVLVFLVRLVISHGQSPVLFVAHS
jgi:hypothetical protein